MLYTAMMHVIMYACIHLLTNINGWYDDDDDEAGLDLPQRCLIYIRDSFESLS